ncbi:hypothetical protein Pelo_8169 [Pelomyxa schiedti]|nr:hypothetical protein Pelo_8169 [Pelomyxa schiedti]
MRSSEVALAQVKGHYGGVQPVRANFGLMLEGWSCLKSQVNLPYLGEPHTSCGRKRDSCFASYFYQCSNETCI